MLESHDINSIYPDMWLYAQDKIYAKLVDEFMEEIDKLYNDDSKIKLSNFYPNADEDGMVDVSDYPFTK